MHPQPRSRSARRLALGVAMLVAATPPAAAFEEVRKSQDGLAMEGYDATAYLDAGRPRAGEAAHIVEWNGAKWRFVDREAADAFAAAPETFAPQFGGYCTGAMAVGQVSRGDPHLWRMKGGRLFLFQSKRGPVKFDRNPDRMISRARKHWERLTRGE